MLQEIVQSQLESGKQYYVESLSLDGNKNIICVFKRIATFSHFLCINNNFIDGPKWACFKYFRKIEDNILYSYDVQLHELWWRYYEVKKYHIQQKLETNVCNIILRDITGDEYFISGF